MGIPTDIYSLFEITLVGEAKKARLLTRVMRDGFANWNQADEDDVNRQATEEEQRLVDRFVKVVLEFDGVYESRKVGELQYSPVGEALADPNLQGDVSVWVATTYYGPPWVVLGTAESEDAFWQEVNEGKDL